MKKISLGFVWLVAFAVSFNACSNENGGPNGTAYANLNGTVQ